MNKILDDVRRDAINCARVDSNGDKESLFQSFAAMLFLAETARRDGLLEMESQMKKMPMKIAQKPLLAKGVEMVVNGHKQEFMEEVLTNEYWMVRPSGYEALELYCFIRGCLMVEANEQPYNTKELLVSLLPITMQEEFETYFKAERDKKAQKDAERGALPDATKNIMNLYAKICALTEEDDR